MSERLDAFLSHQGHGSRSEAKALIRRGAVTMAGRPCRDPAATVSGPVTVDGIEIVPGPDAATLLLHKPVGCACTHDEREAPLVHDLVPPPWQNLPLEMAGRLDRATSGLLILTTDGQLIHRLTNPKRHVAKRYRIGYRGELSAHAVQRCAEGMMLPDDPKVTLPAELILEGPGTATMLLHEGRYHQVRRMIAACGGEVTALHRDRIGALDLPADLAVGTMREMTDAEVAALFA
jgi:16S rRNA pseudouridine516 synthase